MYPWPQLQANQMPCVPAKATRGVRLSLTFWTQKVHTLICACVCIHVRVCVYMCVRVCTSSHTSPVSFLQHLHTLSEHTPHLSRCPHPPPPRPPLTASPTHLPGIRLHLGKHGLSRPGRGRMQSSSQEDGPVYLHGTHSSLTALSTP